MNTLSLETLTSKVPSIFANQASPKVSDKYTFVSSLEILEKFEQDGWKVASAVQKGKSQYHAHEIRLTNGALPAVGDSLIQAVIQNSHNGTKPLQIQAGLFRLVCSNGLTVPTQTTSDFKLRHKGLEMGDIRRITDQFATTLPLLQQKVEMFESKMMTESESVDFVNKATMLRWNSGSLPKIDVNSWLNPLREGDQEPTMWKVFNRVQEKFVRGGEQVQNQKGRFIKMRELKNFDVVNRINSDLWELAESYC
jgi:hypothetical protein